MATRVGINGFGRIGRQVLRAIRDYHPDKLEVAAINDLTAPETTALGAAFLAGLGVGLWPSRQELARRWRSDRTFEPRMSEERREDLYSGWKRALERAKGWAQPAVT